MHGAAHTKRPRPAPACSFHEPGGCQPLEPGQRQEAHEGEAEDNDDEPRHLDDQVAVLVQAADGRADGRAESDEDDRESGEEGQARRHDPPAAHPRLRPRHDREVARHERKDAGSHEGQEAGEECERDLGVHRPACSGVEAR